MDGIQLNTPELNIDSRRIEALKAEEEIIKRMAENSARTKSLFVILSAAIITLAGKTTMNPLVLIGYLVLTVSMWYTDAKYLKLERAFRKHYVEIVKEDIPLKDIWLFDISPCLKEGESTPRIMLSNFTMWLYWIATVSLIVAIAISLFTGP